MNFRTLLGKRIIFFDGAMGTQMDELGIERGRAPEDANINSADKILSIHKSYLDAGADVVTANTFGASSIKYRGEYSLERVIAAGVELAKRAAAGCGRQAFAALDMGPTGKLLEPMGDLAFDEAYRAFAQQAALGEKAGADLAVIETFSDLYEAKAAVLAVKENTSLPVVCTVTLGENGRLLTGADIQTVVAVLEGLRCDAIGLNCSLGPDKLMPFAKEMLSLASVPVLIQPNAGLPHESGGRMVYDISPETFADYGLKAAKSGASLLGGCCGTTPAHIKLLKDCCGDVACSPPKDKGLTVAASGRFAVVFDRIKPVIIGDGINPEGKPDLQEAIASGDYDTVADMAMEQASEGADCLDFNVFVQGTDEACVMCGALTYVQGLVNRPIVLDSRRPEVLAKAARLYNGKPVLNAVTGDISSMEPVFEAAARYGGVVVGLCADSAGLPGDAARRLEIGARIIEAAAAYGIAPKDIILDPVPAAAADKEGLKECLDSIKLIKEQLGVKTVLDISKVSECAALSSALLSMALYAGLDACIIDPLCESAMDCIRASRIILN